MSVIARSGSGWRVPVLVVLVGSLLLDPGRPAAGADGEVDRPAVYSACVGPATASAGFTDMVNSFAEDAVNCLAHYEIAKGTDPGVFSPNVSISRLQMALFLTRAARPAGITLPSGGDRGFTDISRMTPEIQTAINQVAELGIMRGRSVTTFAPTEVVTREDMAVHLAAFLAVATVGPGGVDIDKVTPDDTVFTDVRRVSERAHKAIRNLYEMGITDGTTASTFSPNAPVSRAQMAAFITRTLAHTNARPAGVTVQPSGGPVRYQDDPLTFTVSVRDAGHRPVRGVKVDIFYAVGAGARRTAITGGGECASVKRLGGSRVCVIDGADLGVNGYGNLNGAPTFRLDDDMTVWAWTGELGARYHEDTSEAGSVDIVAHENAAYVQVDADIAGQVGRPRPDLEYRVRYGTTVTFTLQLLDSRRQPVAREGVGINVSSSITTSDGAVLSSRSGPEYTNRSGRVELPYTRDDPDVRANDPPQTLEWKVQRGGVFGSSRFVLDPDGNWLHRSGADAIFRVRWDDDAAAATLLSVAPRNPYVMAPSIGAKGAAVATLLDQYGNPIRNARIEFTIGATQQTVLTNSKGVAVHRYTRASAGPSAEKVMVAWPAGNSTLTASGCQLWVTHPDSSSGLAKRILLVDTIENVVVVDDDGPRLFTYADDGKFWVDGNPVLRETFEQEIDAGDILSWDYSGPMDTYRLTNETNPGYLC